MSRSKSKTAKNKQHKKRERALSFVLNIPENTLQSPWDRGYSECPCPKKCTLHGECTLCVAYHMRNGQLPHCER